MSLKLTVAEWLEAGKLQRIVLVIMSKATSEVLERWNFNIVTDAEVVEKGCATHYLIPHLPARDP
jgi:mitotic spindle assembly checkpoint protein MAD2